MKSTVDRCRCLCSVNHPDQGESCCTSTDDVGIAYLWLRSKVTVWFCYACAAATLAAKEQA